MNDDRAKPTLDVWALLGIGTYNVVCLLVGMGVGWFIDNQLDTFPAVLLVGLACGIGLGVAGTWRQMKPFLRE
jgi:F0F1-type ATP synthase assembly protein I